MIPEPEFKLQGWRVICTLCNLAWWDTDSLDKVTSIKKACEEHSIDRDHDNYIAAIDFRPQNNRDAGRK
jgi:hypothetical protein